MYLSSSDAQFLRAVLELPEGLRNRLSTTRSLTLSDEEADELRDLCGERLQTHGFDHHYSVTPEGRRLERLIDALFVG